MKKAELIAKYIHYGADLISIESKEFFNVMKNTNTSIPNTYKPAIDADCVKFSTGEWDYYCYSSCFKLKGGDKDCDAFYFKTKLITEEDRETIKKIFSQDNDYTEFDECIDGEFSV